VIVSGNKINATINVEGLRNTVSNNTTIESGAWRQLITEVSSTEVPNSYNTPLSLILLFLIY